MTRDSWNPLFVWLGLTFSVAVILERGDFSRWQGIHGFLSLLVLFSIDVILMNFFELDAELCDLGVWFDKIDGVWWNLWVIVNFSLKLSHLWCVVFDMFVWSNLILAKGFPCEEPAYNWSVWVFEFAACLVEEGALCNLLTEQ